MPLGPLKGEGWGGLATEHMMTLSARDCAAALDISAGADVGAPYAAPALPAQSFRAIVADVARDPRAVAPRRIAWLNTTYEGDVIDPEVAAAVAEPPACSPRSGTNSRPPRRPWARKRSCRRCCR